jgi:hypothetical protein
LEQSKYAYQRVSAVEEPAIDESWEVCGSDLVTANKDKFYYLYNLEKVSRRWESIVNNDTVKVWLNKGGTDRNADAPVVKVDAFIDTKRAPADIQHMVNDVETRKKWADENLMEFRELERLADDVVIYYKQNKAPWPFKNRDFVERRFVNQLSNGDVHTCFEAIKTPLMPEKKDFERAETIVGGMFFR